MRTTLAEITAASLVLNQDDPAELLGPRPAAGPQETAGTSVDFDLKRDLGRKGTRTLDRAAGLAMHAVGRLPGMTPITSADAEAVDQPDVGLVLATTMGSIQSTFDFTRDSFTGAKPYHVDPARFPNTVMNFAAGQCAIRYRIQGPNATVTTGHVGSFTALAYAVRLLHSGHAATMVVGASEELSAARAGIERAWGIDAGALGEGAAAVLVRSPGSGDAPIGEILGLDSALAFDPESAESVLAKLGERVLAGKDGESAAPLRVRVVAPRDADPASPESKGLARLVEGGDLGSVVVVDTAAHTGDIGSASGLVQLQAALAALRAQGADGPDDVALVTGTDREGAVHVALVRLPQGTGGETP
ncbi:beta-ketoacyl synthase N-terminal-like domain-containing protein [Myceligenerans crystallogenes]|uniref:Beta-ketoacyl synthase N-terminal-like domain-containing protein n=1 Tax=Myceligenerans crystallogenes TaxID=316335 RepID=A0ABN2NJH9_9MICO